jgi:hypothetical protein
MEEDWELVTGNKKRNLFGLNRNPIQIIPTNANKEDLVHNLKNDERFNMGMNELGVTNVSNYTLIKEKINMKKCKVNTNIKLV